MQKLLATQRKTLEALQRRKSLKKGKGAAAAAEAAPAAQPPPQMLAPVMGGVLAPLPLARPPFFPPPSVVPLMGGAPIQLRPIVRRAARKPNVAAFSRVCA